MSVDRFECFVEAPDRVAVVVAGYGFKFRRYSIFPEQSYYGPGVGGDTPEFLDSGVNLLIACSRLRKSGASPLKSGHPLGTPFAGHGLSSSDHSIPEIATILVSYLFAVVSTHALRVSNYHRKFGIINFPAPCARNDLLHDAGIM